MIMLLMKALVIGFAIAAPVGPIGILCIQRSLNHGFKVGLMTGLGAALADGCYGLIAGFGLTSLSSILITGVTHFLIFHILISYPNKLYSWPD